MSEEKICKLSRVEHFEGESEEGIVYIDIHRPIVEYTKCEGAEDAYGPLEYWGKANLSGNGGVVQVFKFEIKAKTLAQAVKKYEQELERGLKELQENQNSKVIVPKQEKSNETVSKG